MESRASNINLSRLEDGSAEIFYTVQGEGQSLGRPALFVRTSECNLQCYWCDTPNTWNWEGRANVHADDRQYARAEEQVALSTVELAEQILDTGADRIILTGGEPMMQQQQLTETLHLVKSQRPDVTAEVETNGTILPRTFEIQGQETSLATLVDQWNISPKLSSSQNDLRKALKMQVLQRYSQLDTAVFKFVIGSEQDKADALRVIQDAELDARKIWIMPEGRTPQELHLRMADLAEYCKQYGFNLTPRLHIDIWGDKRGV